MKFDEYYTHHLKFNETLNTSPFFYFLKLMEECGEVAEITAAIGGSKRKLTKLGGRDNIRNKLIEELGDVICVALTCAYQYDITPEELFAANAEKLVERMAAKKEEATAPKEKNHLPSREFIHSVMIAKSEEIKDKKSEEDFRLGRNNNYDTEY